MIKINTRGREMEIPGYVEELTPEQYRYLLFLTVALGRGIIDAEYMRVRWMSYLLGMGDTDYTILLPEYIAEIEEQLREGALRGYFTEEDPDTVAISTPLNLMPEYNGRKGPGDWLQGVSFGTFTECLTLMEQLNGMEDAEKDTVCRRVATLLYGLPDDEKPDSLLVLHSLTLLATVWDALQREPVQINGRFIDFRIIFQSGRDKKPDDHTGWTGVTFEVASAGLFGDVRAVEKCDLWEVLLYLYRCRFEQLHSPEVK